MNEPLYDFYYSELTASHYGYQCHAINGENFTEMVETGVSPMPENPILVAKALPKSQVVWNIELGNFTERNSVIFREKPKTSPRRTS